MKMKRVFSLVALITTLILHSSCQSGDPSLEYGDDELKEHAKEICLADLRYEVDHRCFIMMGTAEGARFGNLRWHIQKKEATLVVEELSYHMGDFGKFRHTDGIMGWPFRVYCKSKVITPRGEFSNKSDIGCFIWIRDDYRQFIAPPNHLKPFVEQEK